MIKLRKELLDHLRNLYLEGVSKSKIEKSIHNSTPHIHSLDTYKTYKQWVKQFSSWCYENEVRDYKVAQNSVGQYLQHLVFNGKSAFTIYTAASALAKVFDCGINDFGFEIPRRERVSIKRSRYAAVRDQFVSEIENERLIRFCRSTGLRRREVEAVCGDALRVRNGKAFIYVINGKGGKKRYAEICCMPEDLSKIKKEMRMAGSSKLFCHVNSMLDVHALRAQYAVSLYRKYAEPVEKLERKDKYVCRKEKAGTVYDRRALLIVSKNLGHNRLNVVADNYLYGL